MLEQLETPLTTEWFDQNKILSLQKMANEKSESQTE